MVETKNEKQVTVNRDPETLKKARELRIIDDTLFRMIAARKEVCQEILRTLLNDDKLQVVSVKSQETLVSLYREVTIDALCLLGDETLCNIEMQKGNENDDIRRVRFHSSIVTTNNTPKGAEFRDVPNVKVIYITEYDALHNNQSMTIVERCQKVGNQFIPIDDGESILFANSTVPDDTKQGKLLKRFLEKDSFDDPEFPELSKAMKHFKDTEEGEEEVYRGTGYLQELAREEERKNTERERKRAEEAEKKLDNTEKKLDNTEKKLEEETAHRKALEEQLNDLMALLEKTGIKPE